MRSFAQRSPLPMLTVVALTISPVLLNTVREREGIQDWFDITWILVTRNRRAVFADMQRSAGVMKWLNGPSTQRISNLQDVHYKVPS